MNILRGLIKTLKKNYLRSILKTIQFCTYVLKYFSFSIFLFSPLFTSKAHCWLSLINVMSCNLSFVLYSTEMKFCFSYTWETPWCRFWGRNNGNASPRHGSNRLGSHQAYGRQCFSGEIKAQWMALLWMTSPDA